MPRTRLDREQNEEELYILHNELKEFDLCEKASFSDFCEFMLYVSEYKNSDIDEWCTYALEHEFKYVNHRNPTFKEFTSHHLMEILKIYNYITTNSEFSLGPVKHFAEYAYIYSESNLN